MTRPAGRRAAAVRAGRLGRGGLHDGGAGRGHQATVEGRRRSGLLQPLPRVSAERLCGIVSHTHTRAHWSQSLTPLRVLRICLDFHTVNICPPVLSGSWKDDLIFDLVQLRHTSWKTNAEKKTRVSRQCCERGVEHVTSALGFVWREAAETTACVCGGG